MSNHKIRAEELMIEDGSGRTRFKLSASGNTPILEMYAEDGGVIARLAAPNDNPALQLMDKNKKTVLSVAIAPDGSAAFISQSIDLDAHVSVGMTDGVPNIVLTDIKNNALVISVAGMANPKLQSP